MKLSLLFSSALLSSVVGCSHSPAPTAVAPPPLVHEVAVAPPVAGPPVAAASTTQPTQPPAPHVDPPRAHATALRVDRLVVARGVEAREPVGVDTAFEKGEKRVFAFVQIGNPEQAPGEVTVQFVDPDGHAQAPVDLTIGDSPRFRTWAFTRKAHAPGTWKALVKDERGHLLAETSFDVKA